MKTARFDRTEQYRPSKYSGVRRARMSSIAHWAYLTLGWCALCLAYKLAIHDAGVGFVRRGNHVMVAGMLLCVPVSLLVLYTVLWVTRQLKRHFQRMNDQ